MPDQDRGQPRDAAERAQFHRVAQYASRPVGISFDGEPIVAMEGESLLAALLTARGSLRQHEFDGGRRAGFCLMGACQDCWVELADGRRLRACTTPVEDGMAVVSQVWPKDEVA
ncbi:MAG: (2Fe-2S)-binding protein [Pseudolabrys sp.]|jgi:predicted molibdopterin-dependent oxidoreductase YjgC